jgi:hypothetical protein
MVVMSAIMRHLLPDAVAHARQVGHPVGANHHRRIDMAVSDDAAAIAASQLAAALVNTARVDVRNAPELQMLALYQRIFEGIKRQNR